MLVVEQTLLHHGQPRPLESINVKKLVKLAKQHGACIKVVTAIGDTVLEGRLCCAPILCSIMPKRDGMTNRYI